MKRGNLIARREKNVDGLDGRIIDNVVKLRQRRGRETWKITKGGKVAC